VLPIFAVAGKYSLMPTDHAHTVTGLKLAVAAAAAAVIVGVMVLIGWAFDIAVLKSVLPGWVAMKANTAACFILIGIALWLTARPQRSIFFSRFARLCGLLVGLIGLLTLCEYIFGWNPGIDQWLVREAVGAVGTSDPGRMAPETALSFVLLAAALWITGGSRKTRWTILASVNFGLLVTTLALAAMLAYLTPGLGPYGWFGLTIMAMHTSLLFAMLGMAVITISWQQDILPWSLGSNTTVAFACGMAVLVLVGFNINRSQYWMGEIDRKIAYSIEAQDYIESIVIEVIDAQAHTRGYIITGDELFKARYLEASANSNVKLDALRKLIADNLHQQQQFARIEAQAVEQLQWFQQVIDARQTDMADATRNNMIRHGEGLLNNFRITYSQVKNEHQQFIKELRQEAESVSRFSYITIAAGTLASLLIFLFVIFRLNFAVNERKQKELAFQESEDKFRKITGAAQDAIIIMDADKRISFWNSAATRIFGYTAAEAMGQELHALITPASAHAGFAQAFPRFQQTGDGPIIGKVHELAALRKGGEEFLVELSASATHFGGQWHAIGIVRDITERKQAEEALREKEHLLSESQRIAHVGSWRYDLTGRLSWSDETYRIYGVSPGTFTPSVESLLNLIHPEDRSAMQAWIGACVADKKPDALEFRITLPDGTVRFLMGSGELQYDAENRPRNLTGIVHDITERKQAEDSLKNMATKYRAMFDSSSDAIMLLDDKAFFDCNPATMRIFGSQSRDDFINKHPAQISPPTQPGGEDSTRLANQHIATAFMNGSILFEWTHRRLDGAEFPAEVLLTAMELDGKHVLQATVRDITERKRMEAELQQFNAELESKVAARTAELDKARLDADQANQAKSAFLATMSHEIRTPMNGVIGMLDVLQQSSLKDTQMEMTNIIHDSAFALLAIIDDILDFSKIEAGKLQIDYAPMCVADVVEGACESISHMALKKGVELMLFTDPAIPAVVMGDAGRLRQILINLANNAVKFSGGQVRQGKVSVHPILTESTPEQVMLEFRVTDNGIGMDEATKARLFTPFTQANSSTTRTYGGTGLGLSIARHLAELMGGKITVQSEPGKGSMFCARLPFKLLPDVGRAASTGSGQDSARHVGINPDLQVTGLPCLVVGGTEGIAEDIAAYLVHAGAEVGRVADLGHVKEWIAGRPPGLCIVVIDSAAANPPLEELRAAALAHPEQETRFVVIRRGQRREPRLEDADLVFVDGNVLTRRTLLKAVAIAAGRTKAPDREGEPDNAGAGDGKAKLTPLSREEARKRGRLILVAEDNEINQKVIQQQLTLLGQTADIANNGREALELWQSGDYGILITDLHMPEMDGYELTAAIRAAGTNKPRIPIIAFTANALKGEAEHCLEVGMDDYLSKPVQLVNLKAMLGKWLPVAAEAVPDVGRASARHVGLKPDLQTAAPVAMDVTVLKKLVGDDEEIIRDFLHDFRLSAAKIAVEMSTACASGKTAEAGALAHKLKSSARSVGALALGELCAAMEQAGRAGDTEALVALLPKFEAEMVVVDEYIGSFLAKKE
jgi:PAS domain S-box-containing protein